LFVKISNQEFKKATRFNKNELATKTTIAKSSATTTRKLFVIINSQKLLNKKYSNFDNKFLIRDKFEANTSSIFDNFKIDYKTLLEKKRKKSKQFVIKYKYQLLLKENQKLQISLQDNKISILFTQQHCATSSKNNTLKNNKLFLKKQKLIFDLKLFHLDNYYKKNFKK